MSKSVTINFDQSMHKGVSSFSSDVKLINCFSALNQGRTTTALSPIPGSSVAFPVSPSVGTGCRGSFRASTGPEEDGYLSTLYFVYGDSVYRYSRRGTVIKIGTFNSSNVSGSCTFAENQAQTSNDSYIYVCDQQSIYKFLAKAPDDSIATTWQELPSLPHQPDGDIQVTPSYITWSDYRLIMSVKDSNAFFYSETGTDTFKETNTYFGESSSDRTVRVVAHGGALYAFGAYSYDIFTRTGNRQNPYSNPKSASGKIGLASAESVAVVDEYLFWLGRGETANSGVYVADRQGSITRVSDSGLEEILRTWKYQEYAYGFGYVDRGQIIYCITSQSDDMTLCYNLTTKKWHQASSSADGKLHFWDVSYPLLGYSVDEILFGSRTTNDVCRFDRSALVDYLGRPVTRVWQSPVYTMDLKRFRIIKIVIDVDTGTSESYTRDAKMWVQLSNDGGQTWKERVDRTLGTKGQYSRQIQIVGGGMPRDLVIRIGTSDSIPLKFYQMRLDVEELAR